ncbi:MAG TPA: beta-ketoacyl-ACP synthase [Thermohalobaculum sp.]|nr:beta-ketoacyl-ACP synthase [Thermohalobaculum sp.]
MTGTPPIALDRIAITRLSAVTCLGRGQNAHTDAMTAGRSGLTRCDFPNVDIACYIGRVDGVEGDAFPAEHLAFENRATRLAVAALRADGFERYVAVAIGRWGAGRVGIVLGTATSGVERLEQAFRARVEAGPLAAEYSFRHHSDHHAVASFMIDYLGLGGPGYTISTACSSSAKSIVDGAQLIQMGICDAVLAGGVDSLCMTSLYGFDTLELVSQGPCRPCDAARDGVSIGEGAGFVLLERDRDGARLAGYGETSDAISMSTPPADGAGAATAMRRALRSAGISADEIGFIKLHGTATRSNDAAESTAVAQVFGTSVPTASLKGLVGHTLGAAGAVEAVMGLFAMEAGIVPGTVGLETRDREITIQVRKHAEPGACRHMVSNAFGFGGSNNTLILSQA